MRRRGLAFAILACTLCVSGAGGCRTDYESSTLTTDGGADGTGASDAALDTSVAADGSTSGVDAAVASDDASSMASDADVDAGPCGAVLTDAFSDMSPWATATSNGGTIALNAGTFLSPPTSLHAHSYVTNGATFFSWATRSVTFASAPSAFEVDYSLHLDAWPATALDPGCGVSVEPSLGSVNLATVADTGAINAIGSAGAIAQAQPLYASAPAPGWYDVSMSVTGIKTANAAITIALRPHGSNVTAATTFMTTIGPSSPTGITLQCGVTNATYSGDAGGAMVDVYVDDLVVSVCK
jgi:hypothetical protein